MDKTQLDFGRIENGKFSAQIQRKFMPFQKSIIGLRLNWILEHCNGAVELEKNVNVRLVMTFILVLILYLTQAGEVSILLITVGGL